MFHSCAELPASWGVEVGWMSYESRESAAAWTDLLREVAVSGVIRQHESGLLKVEDAERPRQIAQCAFLRQGVATYAFTTPMLAADKESYR